MDALQAIVDILDSLGPGLVTLIVIVVALILIWLIIRASRRGTAHVKPVEQQARRTRYDVQPAELKVEQAAEDAVTRRVEAEKAAVVSAVTPTTPQIKAEPSTVHEAESAPEPQDSVLHRHYDAEQAAKKAAIADPYPTDSVLRRHYDALHKIRLDTEHEKPGTSEVIAPVELQPEQSVSAKGSIIERTIQKEGQVVAAPVSVRPLKQEAKTPVPQDSVLKRHFVSQMRADIIDNLTPRPTDSVLQRHYDAQVQSELEKRLQF